MASADGAALALLMALTGIGAVYTVFANASGADTSTTNSSTSDIADGQHLFQTACITCHGANLEGVVGRGPSLVGVGQAATYYQVSTGRMPVAQQGAQVPRKAPSFTDEQVEQLAAYVDTFAAARRSPPATSAAAPTTSPRAGSCSA